jgi:hypothetical protein
MSVGVAINPLSKVDIGGGVSGTSFGTGSSAPLEKMRPEYLSGKPVLSKTVAFFLSFAF